MRETAAGAGCRDRRPEGGAHVRIAKAIGLSALLVFASAGCATQLAPAYDQSIFSELATANNDIQALFVTVGPAVEASTFSSRKAAYDHIVAELKATKLQITARPLPNADALGRANQILTKLQVANVSVDPNFSDYPSARSVDDLADTIQHMEAADQGGGLRGDELAAFKNQSGVFLTQAITYESFLKR
jgi:hypothetical protein